MNSSLERKQVRASPLLDWALSEFGAVSLFHILEDFGVQDVVLRPFATPHNYIASSSPRTSIPQRALDSALSSKCQIDSFHSGIYDLFPASSAGRETAYPRPSLSTRELQVERPILNNVDPCRNSVYTAAKPTQTSETPKGATKFGRGLTTAQEVPQVSSTFTLFPKLAVELRSIIWQFALPGPQIIVISRGKCKNCEESYEISQACTSCFLKVNLPANFSLSIYHINREARRVAFRHRPFVAFSTGYRRLPLYVNFAQDTFLFQNENLLRLLPIAN